MHERDCCFGNIDYVHDSDWYCWYCKCCCDFWWSVKFGEHIIYIQRGNNNDNDPGNDNDHSSNDSAINYDGPGNCNYNYDHPDNDHAAHDRSSNYNCAERTCECDRK